MPISPPAPAAIPPHLPTDAIVAITLNCNARCIMCDIWKNRVPDELRPAEFAALPASLLGINITGGEPFMRKDLPEILQIVHGACPRARLVISTNGFLVKRIAALAPALEMIPDLAVRISVDGMGKVHDRIRGMDGAFDRCLSFLEGLRRLGVRDLGFNLTLLRHNVDQLPRLEQLCASLGIELGVTVATDAPLYFGDNKQQLRPATTEIAEALETMSSREYRQLQPRRWFRGWYEKSLVEFLRTGRRRLACDAGSGFFYLDSTGNVYGCHVRSESMGNIRQQGFDEIWQGAVAARVRSQLAGCEQCWMVCTVKSAVRSNWGPVAATVVRQKLAAHLRLPGKPAVLLEDLS